jgi:flagellin
MVGTQAMPIQLLSTLRSPLWTVPQFLRSEAGKLSTNLSTITIRQDFTANMINTLEDGAANLTNADMNEEGANMLMLQTRQQLGTTSLSLASQAAQSVLRLF